MKRIITIYFLILPIAFVVTSCRKTVKVNFHGHVVYSCNGEPAINTNLEIVDAYVTSGPNGSDVICNTTTDNNGNYSVTGDVTNSGIFQYDLISDLPNTDWGVGGTNNTSGSNILINGILFTHEVFNFHVKNVSPFNNNDVLDSLEITSIDSTYITVLIIATNLAGQSIDTIIPRVFSQYNDYASYILTYSSTKNNIKSYQSDTVQTVCFGTTNVNVFY